jgi:cytochrome c peroxidase
LVLIIPNLKHFQDKTGAVATFNRGGDINEQERLLSKPGTNGRSCATCHRLQMNLSLKEKKDPIAFLNSL